MKLCSINASEYLKRMAFNGRSETPLGYMMKSLEVVSCEERVTGVKHRQFLVEGKKEQKLVYIFLRETI
jgi:hypothetical protein